MHYLLQNMIAKTANEDREFSILFRKWSTISKTARRGADRFVARLGNVFETFEMYVQAMHMGVATSQPVNYEL